MPTVKVSITFNVEYESLDWRDDLSSHLDRLEQHIVWDVGGENVDTTVATPEGAAE